MWKKGKDNEINSDFIGPIFEARYKEFLSRNKKAALPYLRRAALLLFPLKPELWEEYMQLKGEIFKDNPRKQNLSKLSKEMEGL